MHDNETIVALATPSGRGGVAVIRISGLKTTEIITKVTRKKLISRVAKLTNFFNNAEIIDQGLALYFEGPNSFTGEDILELHCHGGMVVVELLLRTIVEHGCRLAAPGEFSQRAFLNGKIDLLQAEAIADLIDSNNVLAARASIRSLQGDFSKIINQILAKITELRIYLEASIDFPDEELDLLEGGKVVERYKHLLDTIKKLSKNSKLGNKLRDGIKIVLAGPPNVGKSTLLNALIEEELAIVTEVAGTTRDILRERIDINGIEFDLSDTAGLRNTDDIVELQGIKKTKKELEFADHLLWVMDSEYLQQITQLENLLTTLKNKSINITLVFNKNDLTNVELEQIKITKFHKISISAKTGDGLAELKQHLNNCYKEHHASEGLFIARKRHLQSIQMAYKTLQAGWEQLQTQGALEFIAEDLKYAHNYLGEITGAISSDELLGKIFSSFCIGK